MAATQSERVEHSARVGAGVGEAWAALVDAVRVLVGLDDVTVTANDDGTAQGKVKIRFGAINPTFRYSARVIERNARAHRVAVELHGDDVRSAATFEATVTATARRSGGATQLHLAADVAFTGRPTQLRDEQRQAAVRRLLEAFANQLTDTTPVGADVADQSAEEPTAQSGAQSAGRDEGPTEERAPRKRPRPTPGGAPIAASAAHFAESVDDPAAVEPAPNLPPSGLTDDAADDAGGDAVAESAIESPMDAVIDPAEPDEPMPSAPSFAAPAGIRVPDLDDVPSVNGHAAPPSVNAGVARAAMGISARQMAAKRMAPIAVGIVFVLLAVARRRRAHRS